MKRISFFLLILMLAFTACSLPTPTVVPVPLSATSARTPTPSLTLNPTLPVVAAPQLLSFEMLDPLNGWAVTETGILRTIDGGLTWGDATPSGVSQVGQTASTCFLDSLHAWLILPTQDFSSGTLYRTTDGGLTWISSMLPFSGAKIQFFDTQSGVALADLGAGAGSEAVALFTTSNGGADWTRMYINDPTVPGSSNSLPLGGQKTALGFLNATAGFVGGNTPVTDFFYLYETQDGGHSWEVRSLLWPQYRAGYFAGVESIVFTSQVEGYIVVSLVGEFYENFIYKTNNGGVSWFQIAGNIPLSRSYTILPGPMIFCWSLNHTIYYTLDGQLWDEVMPNVHFGDELRQMQFVDATTGFVLSVDLATSHASFYVTHDTGASWSALIP
jgi:photosystem II stability/assembly factor-like uncharacterized protein